jgi:hypothetical protein
MSRYNKDRSNKHRPGGRGFDWEQPSWPAACCDWAMSCLEVIDDEEFLYGVMGMSKFADVFGGAQLTGVDGGFLDQTFLERYPTLHMLLCDVKDDKGLPRQTCTLTIVVESGTVKAGIRERNHGLSLWVTTRELLGVFTALEEALGQRPVDWRKVDWKGGKARH